MSERDLCDEISDEADLCRNEGAEDIADLLDEARAEILRLRHMMSEAADCIADWGAYADDFFQKKHDLAGDVQRFRENSGPIFSKPTEEVG